MLTDSHQIPSTVRGMEKLISYKLSLIETGAGGQ